MTMHSKTFLVSATLVCSAVVVSAAQDWRQWQGPQRNRHSLETGLLREWPVSGPALVWTTTGVGGGYGSMAVVGDRVFVQGARGSNSLVIALASTSGDEVWSTVLGPVETEMWTQQGAGPRSTPTIDGDRLYAISENGDLACLRTDDGSTVWKRNILSDFGGEQLRWLVSESPLVDGPHLVVTPGGRDAGMAKLDKMTGETVWTSEGLSDTAGYSSIIAADIQGVRTYLTLTNSAGVGVRASDGKLMFRYPRAANNVANIATPVFSNDRVFFTSGYGTGGGLLSLTVEDGDVKADEVYFTLSMKNHHGGVVLVGDYLYGYNDSILTSLEFATGEVMWRDRSVGKGTVTYADGRLYIQGENNLVALADATPEGYRERGRFEIPDKGLPSWAHPVISGGRLYVRNQDTLLVYDIRAQADAR
jgi:outer membrane protein assembly factor BamB